MFINILYRLINPGPISCWKNSDGTWSCRWGKSGKIYKSKDKKRAWLKAREQEKAIRASGWKE